MKELIQKYLQDALIKLNIAQEASITISQDPNFGDFSSAVAMQIAKELKQNPLEISKKIIEHIPENTFIAKAEPVAPGFINIWIQDENIKQYAENFHMPEILFGKGKTVITDSSHPNIAKPMGVHHLLSTIIGASINNLLGYCGYTVIRDNFLGDFGTQFGKVLYAYKNWGNKEAVEQNPIPELLKLYVLFHQKLETEPELEEEGRKEFKKLEEGDQENKMLWKWMVDISLQGIEKIYEQLHVSFDLINGESFYEDKMQEILEFGKQKGVFVEGEKGALVVHFDENENLPTCVIQKSDGATLYHTRDLARTLYWERTFHPDIMLICTDVAQELHFQQLFSIVKKLGLTDAENVHISFGRMQFKDRDMSTRKGNILELQTVLDTAIEKSKELIESKKSDMDKEEQEKLAQIIGIGAIKYAILSQTRSKNIIFEWDKIVSLDGNSGPYLQYTYTRAQSILKKSSDVQISNEVSENTPSLDPKERALILHFMKYEDVIIESCKTYRPNFLANYLYELAQLFNSFYNSVPVNTAEESVKAFRLQLVKKSADMIRTGLGILGIEVPERM